MAIQTLTGFELLSDWLAPPKVGNNGGATPTGPSANTVWIPGTPATFVIQGLAPWADVYLYRNIPGDWSTYTAFEYKLDFSFPSSDAIAACQAVECELQQVVNGHIYNMALQFDISGSKLVRTFDYATSQWIATDIPVTVLQLVPGAVNNITARFLRNSTANTITHLSLAVNGIDNLLNITRTGVPTTENDYLHCALQLDSQYAPKPYMVHFGNIGVTALETAV